MSSPWLERERVRYLAAALQVGLLVLVIGQYRLESSGFLRLSVLAWGGFLVHALLPMRWRRPFFVALGFAGIGVVLGYPEGLWLAVVALGLFATCAAPLSLSLRYVLFGLAMAFLVAVQLNWIPQFLGPRSRSILPILGSMFMFRGLVFLYDLRHERTPRPLSEKLAYFFLLPNVCFPLFPVVDFKTFGRTYYGRPASEIYQTGISWMLRGTSHLLAYRLIYHEFALAPSDVHTGNDLLQFLGTNFLLYLRISGQFHMIVGMLHLFGFALPETNHKYLLSSSFTDFWRRINIYWKDFMMKLFYYPAYMRLRSWGETTALVLATVYVFAITWLLHSYQWLWLRGSFPVTAQDALFWGALGGLVVVNSVWEARRGRPRRLALATPGPGQRLGHGLRVVGTMAAICVLWSLWTCDSLGQWLALWSVDMSPSGFAGPALPIVVLGGLAAGFLVRPESGGGTTPIHGIDRYRRSIVITVVSLVAIALVGLPQVHSRLGFRAPEVIGSLRETRLSHRDANALLKGYYENLLNVDRFNTPLWELYMNISDEWRGIIYSKAWRRRDDFLYSELVPGADERFKGKPLTINRWGMRDQDYTVGKPAGTRRIAVLGSSHTMGSGVESSETFEAVLENRLGLLSGPGAKVQILNFAVEGYTPLQQIPLLEERVVRFQPDAILFVGHTNDLDRSVRQLANVLGAGITIPYGELQSIVERAAVPTTVTEDEAERRLAPFEGEILDWSYAAVVQACRQRGIRPVWTIIPTFWHEPRERTQDVLRRARAAGFEVLDLTDVFEGRDTKDLTAAIHDVHWNAEAHRLVADRLWAEYRRGHLIDLDAPVP